MIGSVIDAPTVATPAERPRCDAWFVEMREIEQRIASGDRAAIRARWESGHHVLKLRVGKQLPNGLLRRVCRVLAVSQQELSYRVRFAEAYPTEHELTTAMRKFGSWTAIRTNGLPRKRERHGDVTARALKNAVEVPRAIKNLAKLAAAGHVNRGGLEELREQIERQIARLERARAEIDRLLGRTT